MRTKKTSLLSLQKTSIAILKNTQYVTGGGHQANIAIGGLKTVSKTGPRHEPNTLSI